MRPSGLLELSYLEYLRRALPAGEPPRFEEHRRNLFGFRSALDDYRNVEESDFAIGTFGGSVASNPAVLGGEELASALGALRPELAGRVRVLREWARTYGRWAVAGLSRRAAPSAPTDARVGGIRPHP